MPSLSILLVFCTSILVMSGDNTHDISKRSFYLMFPRNTILQFTYGLTVPFILPRRSINISWCYQAQYNLPYNVSNFYPQTIAVRKNSFSFDLSRIKFYEFLSKLLSNLVVSSVDIKICRLWPIKALSCFSFGLHGDDCVLRSICEIAEIPMYKREESVLERIVEFLFTPSLELDANFTSKSLDDEHTSEFTARLLRAEELGKSEGNCDEKYSKCLVSVVDLMTVLYVT